MLKLRTLTAGVSLGLAVWSAPVLAEGETELNTLLEALRIEDAVAIMQREGLRYGAELGVEMLPGVNPSRWEQHVARIYDAEKMEDFVTEGFEAALEGAELAPLIAFFASDTGQQVTMLELSAREAFLLDETEAVANEAYAIARAEKTPLFEQVETLIADSRLVDFNVMGALNSNLMFYRGLADGGALSLSEGEMLDTVWAQEPDIRESSADWLGAFLLLAYQPLEDDELAEYAEFYRSDDGQVLNSAIFKAYDQMYETLSYQLGRAVAEQMQSEDL